MDRATIAVLEEFNDDIQKVCQEVLGLRDTIEEKEGEIEKLNDEINDHECE